jgi:RHS repeat-associated protein
VRSPGGAISRAWYTPRGLVDSTKTVNFRSTGDVSGTTRYTWDTRFAAATQVVGAGGDISQYSYNADGTVAWVQPGTDPSRRTTVAYYTTGGLTGRYRASSVPGRSERDSVVYDATLGNTIQVKDRRGYWSYSTRDGLGRVALQRGEFQASHWRRDSTEYDLADRVVWTRSWADTSSYLTVQSGGGYIDADTLYVSNAYDPEGNLLAVKRWTRPNPAGLDTIADNFLYDEAGRRTSEWNVAGVDNTYSYDAAGNLVLHQSLTKNITSKYDELGRVVQRITGKRVYTGTSCQTFVPWGIGPECRFSFPLQTNGAFLTIPADTALFAYDATGNMLRADNVSARIRRTYSPGGLLLTDSSYVCTLRYLTEGNVVPSQFAAHPYGIRYAYDQAGRLDTLWHPDLLDPCTGPCAPQRYLYDSQLGRLTSLIDVRGQTIGFAYTLAGQLEAVNYPGGISELTHYDADGLVADRSVGSATSKFIADTLQHDPLGRITFGTGKVVRNGQQQTVTNAYKGLGALAATEHTIYGGMPTFEEFKTDGLGNVTWSNRHQVHLGGSADNPSIRDHLYDAHGRVVHIAPEDTVQLEDYDHRHYWYDNEGRILFQTHRVVNEESYPNQEAHYYDGAGRLVMIERRVGWAIDTSLTHINDPMGLTEYYRYDALGRRVLVHTLRDNSRCFQLGCESTVARFVWAGDQLLYETRGKAKSTDASWTVEDDAPYGDGEYGAPNAYGRVAYTHAGGIDRPLGMIRMNYTVLAAVYPHANWRGLYETATDESGNQYASRDVIKWPGVVASIYMGATTKPDSVFWWFGSQITESEDASGLMYRRNRYYDPASGRFTQPDPIGIAGGLNAYGFGEGDPINFSDPLGLCPLPLAVADGPAPVADAIVAGICVGELVSALKTALGIASSAQDHILEARLDKPADGAEGAHVTITRDPMTRKVTRYQEWKPNQNPRDPKKFVKGKRYDGTGESHYNKVTKEHVQTPHVHDPDTPGGVRPPRPEEVPGG